MTLVRRRDRVRSGPFGASTRVELAPPWTPQPRGSAQASIESGREARAAAAGALRVRVLEGEPALAELAVDVVDLDAHQVHRAHRIDEALHAVGLADEVAWELFLVAVDAVLEALS